MVSSLVFMVALKASCFYVSVFFLLNFPGQKHFIQSSYTCEDLYQIWALPWLILLLTFVSSFPYFAQSAVSKVTNDTLLLTVQDLCYLLYFMPCQCSPYASYQVWQVFSASAHIHILLMILINIFELVFKSLSIPQVILIVLKNLFVK